MTYKVDKVPLCWRVIDHDSVYFRSKTEAEARNVCSLMNDAHDKGLAAGRAEMLAEIHAADKALAEILGSEDLQLGDSLAQPYPTRAVPSITTDNSSPFQRHTPRGRASSRR